MIVYLLGGHIWSDKIHVSDLEYACDVIFLGC